jgi:hypothetical protein
MQNEVSSSEPAFDKLIVRFYVNAVVDEKATNGWTEEFYDIDTGEKRIKKHPGAGIKKFVDEEWIEIRIPGNVAEVRHRAVRPGDTRKHAREYAAFKQGLADPLVGTPIESLPFLSPAQVAEFKSAGLRTAENVRDVSDSDASKFLGMHGIRRRVSDFLAAAAGEAPILSLRADNEQMAAQIKALQAQIAEIGKAERKAK